MLTLAESTLARIPLRRSDRRPWDPVIVMGGSCASINPLPMAEFVDVFALGAVFYEMATGRPAFAEGNVLQVMDRIRNVDPDAMASEAGEPFTTLLRTMLLPDPTERDVDMRRIVAEIDAVCESV